ncbi:hypothetical protein EJ05DRAFT_502018 [Pseudovirgaria hyperparasitica]|uniref:Paraoxonase n=1 Tax=Pseudovirgaria hyperparasitica TaxID=470096 RepID=A0A6A6W624_9PEZI|nr:uncharacterized protein EJ05DRAFT_502018 [Pseudovirgaria hyperparasitica]KAF2756511.1 hypothetical protein EJ05DRAFT_502018 [Pseudovirgaria hyperparasitica]
MLGKVLNVAVFVAFAAFGLDRLPVINTFIANAPSKLAIVQPHRYVYPLKELKNCEDAVMVRSVGFGILSCDPGRDHWNPIMECASYVAGLNVFDDPKKGPPGHLVRYMYKGRNMASHVDIELVDYPETGGEFHPLGIEYHEESKTLFVINNLSTGKRLEIFSDHETYITNCQYFGHENHHVLQTIETLVGLPLGGVFYVNFATNEVRSVARVPFANGVVLLNSTHVAVASTTKTGIYFYERNSTTNELSHKRTVRTKHFVDNLSVDDSGALILAGHPHLPSLEQKVACAARRDDPECLDVKAGSWIQEWTEQEGLKDLYVGHEFESACTAVRDKAFGRGFAVGLYGEGILLWGQLD